jgi:hypothetical protein
MREMGRGEVMRRRPASGVWARVEIGLIAKQKTATPNKPVSPKPYF